MTKWQAIALGFPFLTLAGAAGTAWLVKKIWIDRPYPEELADPMSSPNADNVSKARALVQEVERLLERTH